MPGFDSQDKRAAPYQIWEIQETLGSDRRNDPRTVSELFDVALQGDYDDDAPWDAVVSLRLRATPEVLDFAMKHCRSDDPTARARGLDVLAQLGAGKPESERPYLGGCVSMAIARLKDVNPSVVLSAAWALAHLGDDKAIATLIGMKHHEDAGVRHAVAVGMGCCSTEEAMRTVIELMEDPDNDVRDWATFGLGTLNDADSPEIRGALRERLDDSFSHARDEAVWGLVRRNDSLGLQVLLERLESESCVVGDELAAEELLGMKRGASREELRQGLQELLRQ